MNAELVGARLGTGVACAVCCGLPMLVVAGVVTVSARRGVRSGGGGAARRQPAAAISLASAGPATPFAPSGEPPEV